MSGKTALVLGVANRWSLAYAIAQAFVREGGDVVLTYQGDRQKETVEELAAALSKDVRAIACNVTKPEELDQLVASIKNNSDKLDAVVHSIAFANPEDLSRPFVETSRDGYLLAQEVSSYSLLAVARAVAPLMTKGGSILTLTYLGAVKVVPNYNVMGVAKAALEAVVRYLASDLGPANIRVNAISAGPIKTLAARGIAGLTEMLKSHADRAPLKRNVDTDEVAATATFLCSQGGSGITGETIYVDCGYNIMGF